MGVTKTTRRVVLALTHDAAPQAALRTAASLARLLSAELHGFLIEDEAPFAAAALPFTRHLDPASHRWQPLSPESLAEQYAAAAAVLRRYLLQAAAAAGVAARFTVLRGDPVESLARGAGPSDLMAVLEPPRALTSPIGLLGPGRSVSADAWAAILHVPRLAAPRAGPVIAVVSSVETATVTVAARIAAQAGEKLLIVDLTGAPPARLGAALRATPLDPAKVRVIVGRYPLRALLDPELVGLRARLVVLQRDLFDRIGTDLAHLLDGHSVPWLLLGRSEQLL